MEEQSNNLPMINLTIDGQSVSVPKGTTVYHALNKIGAEVPIFCYHDRMPPFGACRVCLVEVEKAPKLQTSCTLEAAEGMVVKTQSEKAVQGRKEILEFLLLNHPLDCPICDRGGECPLQENTLRYGPGLSRFFEEKRHFQKPYPLGPVLMLDRERCIVCARCTRFSDELSGDHALQFIDRGYRTEVGTPHGGPAESKFIGNTIMICPVGALTSQVYRFRARPWDNTPTRSTCTLCPVGCSMILDSRDGQIMRTRSQENPEVNDIWLCDKGWFGYEHTYHPERLSKPLIRKNGLLEEADWEDALDLISQNMRSAKSTGKAGALGGNPLTFEENYLFQKLIREALGVNNIDHRLGEPLFPKEEEVLPPGMEISIGECENLKTVFLLGLDLTEEFPVIWLRLRKALQKGAKVYYFGHYLPEISPYLTQCILHRPNEEMEILQQHSDLFRQAFENEKKGAVFIGRQYLHNKKRGRLLAYLKDLAKGKSFSLNVMEGKGNSLGARMAGMRPDFGPLGSSLQQPGLDADQMISEINDKGWDFLYIAGADLAEKLSSAQWIQLRQQLKFLVVQDLFLTETARQADVVLPALTFIEKGGHFLNIEGRLQPLLPGKEIPNNLYSDGEIFQKIARKLQIDLSYDPQFNESLKRKKIPLPILDDLPPSHFQNQDPLSLNDSSLYASFIPILFDQGIRMKHNSHLIELSPAPKFIIHPKEAEKRGIKEDDKIKIKLGHHSIEGIVKLSKGVSLQTILLPTGFPDQVPLHHLSQNLWNGLEISMEKA